MTAVVKPKRAKLPKMSVPEICSQLQGIQRYRTVAIKSRIKVENRLRGVVATSLGYHAFQTEKERAAGFAKAAEFIKKVRAKDTSDDPWKDQIDIHCEFIEQMNVLQKAQEQLMIPLVRQLPVHAWVKAPEQRGFGELTLAVVIGETGDLANYANPAKVWRRMGCAPWSFNGETHMGATWRSGREGKLPKLEWTNYGYSPQRRSIAYLIGVGLLKQNTAAVVSDEDDVDEDCDAETDAAPGPYKLRYIEAKARAAETHPEWTACECKGTGKGPKGKRCPGCPTVPGKKMRRCHLHGMLLASKLLLKNLWIEWNK